MFLLMPHILRHDHYCALFDAQDRRLGSYTSAQLRVALQQLHPNVGDLGDIQVSEKRSLLEMVEVMCKSVASARVQPASSTGPSQAQTRQQPSAQRRSLHVHQGHGVKLARAAQQVCEENHIACFKVLGKPSHTYDLLTTSFFNILCS